MTIIKFFCSLAAASLLFMWAHNADAKRLSISFDDAPMGKGPVFKGSQRTSALIEALRVAEAGPVVFFVLTKHLGEADNRRRIAQYAAAGHLIANHSHSHLWLHKSDVEDYLTDIDRAETALTGFANRRAWFRYPYLDEGRDRHVRGRMEKALSERNLKNGYVTIDNYDWYLQAKWQEAIEVEQEVDMDALRDVYLEILLTAVAFYDGLAQTHLKRSPIHTLLLHENDLAAMFVGDLIAALREDGWQIVDPDTAYEDPIAQQIPKTLITGQGRVAALAVDAGAAPKTLTHLAIEERQIDALIAEKNVFTQP